ncbi:MBL fold metallo-hydrolase [uncultured Porticoccus sp.]|uniref:MBL fold metallo-hydrolase RNA specificity domain-containing protein n=1 Tax=uncultured Porticoccus sp. TaxID=1256050 RepID=UPI002601FF12|nr:MBL fold metallo-hydrolase [uncultured Porticoccus sp.]
MKITFLGAADTVTGSRFLLEHGDQRLLVDCGLFQGGPEAAAFNREALPFSPGTLDAVLVTHGHIDHSGFLPALVANDCRGPIYATPATAELCGILLPDSARLQNEDFGYLERHGLSTPDHEPLYSEEDVEKTLKLFQPQPMQRSFPVSPGVTAQFVPAGHILGAASLYLQVGDRRLCFSGDLGRPVDRIMQPPEPFAGADYLLVESTYGTRQHPATDPALALEQLVNETAHRGGTVVVPAFAVGRAQSLLHLLARATDAGRIPNLPVFLDSPMAINATKLFCRYPEAHRLNSDECEQMCGRARYTRKVQDSKQIFSHAGAKIIIAASGMATGGRILHHLKHYLPDARNTLLIVGYQAPGTLGAKLQAGAMQAQILGQDVTVEAQVATIEGLSAHADQAELTAWLREADPPRQTFVIHGDTEARRGFADHITRTLNWTTICPDKGQTIELE